MQKELGSETESWGLRQDGSLVHNNIVLDKISTELEEGDVIVSWTDINSRFFLSDRSRRIDFLDQIEVPLERYIVMPMGHILDLIRFFEFDGVV